MQVAEFPSVNVGSVADKLYSPESNPLSGSGNPFYPGVLLIPIIGRNEYVPKIASFIPQPTESSTQSLGTPAFLGVTTDLYVHAMRGQFQELSDITPEEVAHGLVSRYMDEGWVYGVVLPENGATKSEAVLKTSGEARGINEILDRVFWVPSEKLSHKLWGLDYNPDIDLGEFVRHEVGSR